MIEFNFNLDWMKEPTIFQNIYHFDVDFNGKHQLDSSEGKSFLF